MKKIFIVVVCLLYTSVYSQDEKNKFGIIVGYVNSSFIDYEGEDSIDYIGKLGVCFGVSSSFNINNTLSIRPELLYLKRGGSVLKMKGGDRISLFSSGDNYIFAEIKESRISVPVFIDFKLSPKFSIGIGSIPAYSFNREFEDEEYKFEGLVENNVSENLDLSLGLDLGYSTSQLRLFMRYNYGITKRQGLINSIFQMGVNFKLDYLIDFI